ncbi:MFS transporter [Flavimarina sp. Hel_I_48]|uniref:MFS transporter n=1 Tax=Flavimarina sp. Hel_I_48 TaxID=1392488 RepID=UPI00068E9FC7|nr:MFS transporter [Flavimarina sp. Hel_I_48]
MGKKSITVLLILSQFLGTSLWFVGNISIPQLPIAEAQDTAAISNVLAAVQFGFILGTLLYAFLLIADRFSPSRVFLCSALLAAFCNMGLLLPHPDFYTILTFRFFTGFFLAGIYPVGMKIAADYYEKGLGLALGYLVGALVLGTAFPHFLNSFGFQFDYVKITVITSFLALLGGLLVGFCIPDGPFRRKQQQFKWNAFALLFKTQNFRKAAYGYFGHMWELYAFWAFLPVLIHSYTEINNAGLNVALWSFFGIAIGALSCALGGHLSVTWGSKKVAGLSLRISGFCCLISPFAIMFPSFLFLVFILLWGAAVVADSPQFSRMIAANTTPETRGSALTLVNCIGFGISVVSIQVLGNLPQDFSVKYGYLLLALGPAFGLWKIGGFQLKMVKNILK